MKTVVLSDDLSYAVDTIKTGGLVIVPTETVYGLAASAFDEAAVMSIYEVKGRPETKPISLLISGMHDAENAACDIPPEAYALAEKFWPGPLTMILKKKPVIPDIVTAGGDTVGVRCPDHKKTLELIEKSKTPLAAPSANLSGQPSPKNLAQAMEYFDGLVPCAIDGGDCTVGIESTIIDMTKKPFKVLRLGGLSPETIKSETGIEVEV